MSRDLAAFLHPRSIAFVGGHECEVATRKTLALGYDGRIRAVRPKREHLGGIRTVQRVEEIDGPVDAAFVAVKREPTIEVVRALRAKGCGGAVRTILYLMTASRLTALSHNHICRYRRCLACIKYKRDLEVIASYDTQRVREWGDRYPAGNMYCDPEVYRPRKQGHGSIQGG